MKVKCFSSIRYQNKRLTAIQPFACCSYAAEGSKAAFIKMVMVLKTHVISRKILMMKSKDRKCNMYLKCYINPPYIAQVSTLF